MLSIYQQILYRARYGIGKGSIRTLRLIFTKYVPTFIINSYNKTSQFSFTKKINILIINNLKDIFPFSRTQFAKHIPVLTINILEE